MTAPVETQIEHLLLDAHYLDITCRDVRLAYPLYERSASLMNRIRRRPRLSGDLRRMWSERLGTVISRMEKIKPEVLSDKDRLIQQLKTQTTPSPSPPRSRSGARRFEVSPSQALVRDLNIHDSELWSTHADNILVKLSETSTSSSDTSTSSSGGDTDPPSLRLLKTHLSLLEQMCRLYKKGISCLLTSHHLEHRNNIGSLGQLEKKSRLLIVKEEKVKEKVKLLRKKIQELEEEGVSGVNTEVVKRRVALADKLTTFSENEKEISRLVQKSREIEMKAMDLDRQVSADPNPKQLLDNWGTVFSLYKESCMLGARAAKLCPEGSDRRLKVIRRPNRVWEYVKKKNDKVGKLREQHEPQEQQKDPEEGEIQDDEEEEGEGEVEGEVESNSSSEQEGEEEEQKTPESVPVPEPDTEAERPTDPSPSSSSSIPIPPQPQPPLAHSHPHPHHTRRQTSFIPESISLVQQALQEERKNNLDLARQLYSLAIKGLTEALASNDDGSVSIDIKYRFVVESQIETYKKRLAEIGKLKEPEGELTSPLASSSGAVGGIGAGSFEYGEEFDGVLDEIVFEDIETPKTGVDSVVEGEVSPQYPLLPSENPFDSDSTLTVPDSVPPSLTPPPPSLACDDLLHPSLVDAPSAPTLTADLFDGPSDDSDAAFEARVSDFVASVKIPIPKTPAPEEDRFDVLLRIDPSEITKMTTKSNGQPLILGKGSFGVVFLCKWDHLGEERIVAVKEVNTVGLPSLETIEKEVKMVKYLASPLVIRVFGYYKVDEFSLAIVMEYLDGGSLYDFLRKNRGRVTWRQKWMFTSKIVRSVAYLHSAKIVHRDLKPHNWLISRDGQKMRICDFGLAKIKVSGKSAASLQGIKGTPRYIAPESICTAPTYSAKSDIFSLGMSIYTLTEERLPFHSIKDEIVVMFSIRNRDQPTIDDSTPDEFRHMIEWCIAYDPDGRPTANELIRYMKDHEADFLARYPEEDPSSSPSSSISGSSSTAVDSLRVASASPQSMVESQSMVSAFRCPLSEEIYRDPVLLADSGETYERSAIEKHLEFHDTDPVTGALLQSKTLIPNRRLQRSIAHWLAARNLMRGGTTPSEDDG